MAITKKLKALIKHAAEVICMYQQFNNEVAYTITPYTGEEFSNPDSVTIRITNGYSLHWEFGEPLAAYLTAKKVTWEVRTESDNLIIDIS